MILLGSPTSEHTLFEEPNETLYRLWPNARHPCIWHGKASQKVSSVGCFSSAEVQEYWHNMSMGLVRCPSGCASIAEHVMFFFQILRPVCPKTSKKIDYLLLKTGIDWNNPETSWKILKQIWWFPEIGVPQSSSISWDFPLQTDHFWIAKNLWKPAFQTSTFKENTAGARTPPANCLRSVGTWTPTTMPTWMRQVDVHTEHPMYGMKSVWNPYEIPMKSLWNPTRSRWEKKNGDENGTGNGQAVLSPLLIVYS